MVPMGHGSWVGKGMFIGRRPSLWSARALLKQVAERC